MTEEEWLNCTSANKMLCHIREKASDRKLRLVACACCRLRWPLLRKASRKAVEIAELLADGLVNAQALERAVRAAREVDLVSASYPITTAASMALRAVVSDGLYAANWTVNYTDHHLEDEAHLLRDLFGNPFRTVAVDRGWVKPAVVALARSIYEERLFEDLPVLADALEEAGCTNADILSHLRGPGPHVRGCWVVDLILGKE
ncbi:MAG: hypothetical protein L0Z62_14130 [Gemmataceae bacterium]|nr:hypothetical protein [Gemmataceae bacterium]